MSRKLGPPLYAEFSVLFALMIALSRPINILSSAVTRLAVTGRTAGTSFEEIEKFSIKLGLAIALILGLGPILLSSLISDFLKTGSLLLFMPLGLTLFIWSLTGVLRGLFASLEKFGILSYTSAAELFVRAVFGIAFVLLGFKVLGAIASSAIGALFVFILLSDRKRYIVTAYNERKQHDILERGFGSITSKVFFIALPMGFFLELDVLLAKRFFAPEEAGIYAAAALVGKGLLMFSTIASTVVYPKLIEERLSKKGVIAFLWGIGITLLLFVVGYLLLNPLGKPVIGLLFGDKYKGVIELAPRYVLALIPLAVHLQITNYKGAIGSWVEGVWLWIVLGGYYLSLELSSSTLTSYLWAIFKFHLVTAPISFFLLYLRYRKSSDIRILPNNRSHAG